MDAIQSSMFSRRTALKGLGFASFLLSPQFAEKIAAQSTIERITIATAADISTLDPHTEPTTNFSQLLQSFENVIEINADLQVQPALATSWEMVNDTTWHFHLREGVKFHNGATLTAEDVAWNFNRILASDATSGPKKAYTVWLKSAEVVDELTVQLNTLIPYPAVVVANYIPIMIPKAYFEEVGADGFNQAPIGTGPYKIDSWSVNESLELSAFADYWGGPPPIPAATFRVIPEESTRLNELETGGVDIVLNLSATRVAELESSPDITITSKPSVLNFYLGMNSAVEPLNNLTVRQAIAHAVDVPLMVETLLSGYGEVANSLVHSTSFGWMKDLASFPYDTDQAKQLLTEAGYPDGFSASFYGGPGVWPLTDEAGQAISGFLAEVGIDAPFTLLEWGDYFDRYRNSELDGLFLWGNSSPGLEASTHLTLNFRSGPTGRGLYWNSPETDALIDQTNSELDSTNREQIYFQIQQILHDQVAAVPLWNYEEIDAVGPRITWQARGDFYIRINAVSPVG